LVDDDALLSDLYVAILRHHGHEVIVTRSEDPSCLVSPNGVELVITDLLMLGMNGWDLIEAIRRSNPVIPVLAISGGGGTDPKGMLDHALRLGADRVLAKPFHLDLLASTVAEMLEASGAVG
jgi:DNA-binding response OmpR family regulator